MKLQTNDTWNSQVKWDTSGRQFVLYEVISCKMEISWLHENQTLKWLWRKMKWLLNWVAKFCGYTKSKSQITWDEWQKSEISEKFKEDITLYLSKWLKRTYESLCDERKNFTIAFLVKHYFRNSHLEVLRKKKMLRD